MTGCKANNYRSTLAWAGLLVALALAACWACWPRTAHAQVIMQFGPPVYGPRVVIPPPVYPPYVYGPRVYYGPPYYRSYYKAYPPRYYYPPRPRRR